MDQSIIRILIIAILLVIIIIIIKNIKRLRKSDKVVNISNLTNQQLEDLNELDVNYQEVYLDLFKSNVELGVEENVDEKYVEKCVSHLNNLNDSVIDEMCKKLLGYYVRMLEVIKDAGDYESLNEIMDQMPKKVDGREILQCIKPFTLIIEQPKEDIPAFTLYCDCVWEPEHGAWLILKGDKILFCGDICEIGPWKKEEVYQEELGLLKDYFNDYDFVVKKLKDFTIEK